MLTHVVSRKRAPVPVATAHSVHVYLFELLGGLYYEKKGGGRGDHE